MLPRIIFYLATTYHILYTTFRFIKQQAYEFIWNLSAILKSLLLLCLLGSKAGASDFYPADYDDDFGDDDFEDDDFGDNDFGDNDSEAEDDLRLDSISIGF